MKVIHFTLEDDDYERALKRKGSKTWAEYVSGR